MKEYRHASWKQFRQEVIKLDGGVCTHCSRGPNDGVTLQVHHKIYIQGRKIWEYPHNQCDTLCKGCHAKEHGKITPTEGWEYVGEDDLGSLDGECEYCGTELRYVFFIQHQKWPAMEVGTNCCDNLTSTTLASDHRRKLDRMKNFVSSKHWHRDEVGYLHINKKGFAIEIYKVLEEYKIKINGVFGKEIFPTELETQIAIFKKIDSGVVQKYFKKRNGQ